MPEESKMPKKIPRRTKNMVKLPAVYVPKSVDKAIRKFADDRGISVSGFVRMRLIQDVKLLQRQGDNLLHERKELLEGIDRAQTALNDPAPPPGEGY